MTSKFYSFSFNFRENFRIYNFHNSRGNCSDFIVRKLIIFYFRDTFDKKSGLFACISFCVGCRALLCNFWIFLHTVAHNVKTVCLNGFNFCVTSCKKISCKNYRQHYKKLFHLNTSNKIFFQNFNAINNFPSKKINFD